MEDHHKVPVFEAIAFALQSTARAGEGLAALSHVEGLATAHGHHYQDFPIGNFRVGVVTREPIFGLRAQGIELRLGSNGEARDRRLTVTVTPSSISVSTDWAGSIPCFYSNRANGLILSNIEPCVVLGSRTSWSDLSESGLYGFLRLSHLLWDETVWKHINQVTPDSITIFDLSGPVPKIRRGKSVIASDLRHGFERDALAVELRELNATLVEVALRGQQPIVLRLAQATTHE